MPRLSQGVTTQCPKVKRRPRYMGGFIGTLRLSERTGKNRMVCTITMAGVEELESLELL